MKSLPIRIFIIYISCTLLLSFYGPMKYYNYDKLPVLIYIVLFLFCLFCGYALANRYKIVLHKSNRLVNKNALNYQMIIERKILRFVSFSIVVALISISLEFIQILLENPSAFSFGSMASNYISLREDLDLKSNYSFPVLFRFLTGFFRNVAVILSVYYWEKLRGKDKRRFFLYLALLFMVNIVAYGTQKFIGDLAIYLLIVFAVKKIELLRKLDKKYIVFGILIIMVTILFFSYVQSQRYALIGVTANNIVDRSGGYQYFDTNHIIFRMLGEKNGLGLATILTAYLSAGYYGLSLCFKIPFEWTYGIGNSYFVSKLASVVFGLPNMYEDTYLSKLGEYYGRDGLRTWNTIFPWLASDFTFIGTLLIFIVVGYVWQTTWLEVIRYNNPVSLILFATISLGLIFVPANNQLFHGIDTYVSTLFIVIYWMFNHKKYNYIANPLR